MTDYAFESELLADPFTFQRADNAAITVYDVADANETTPLVLKDLNGLPLSNPLTSSAEAFVPAFVAPSAQVKMVGGGLRTVKASYQGVRDEAVAAKIASQAAADAAQAAAEHAQAPTDAQVDAGVVRANIPAQVSAVVPGQVATAVPPLVAQAIAKDPSVVNGAAAAAQNTAGIIPAWRANEAVTAGQRRVAPNGDIVSAKVNFTTGTVYNPANWNGSTQDGRIGTLEANRYDRQSVLTTASVLDSLDSGLYRISSSSVAGALGMPTSNAGSLWVHVVDSNTAAREWRPGPSGDVWEQRKSGGIWGSWATVEWGKPSLTPTAAAPLNLDTFRTEGVFEVPSLTSAQNIIGLPITSTGTFENLYTKSSVTWTQRFTVTGNRDASLTGVKAGMYFRSYRTISGDGWNPWQLVQTKVVGPLVSGNGLSFSDTGVAYVPRSIGTAGFVYGSTTTQVYPIRSGDSFNTPPEQGPDFRTYAGSGTGLQYVTRTTAGFVAVWGIDSTHSSVWFATDFQGPYTKVLDMGPWLHTGLSKPVLVAGTTWLLWGEYTNAILPSWPLKRYLSTDGGQSWTMVKQTTVTDSNVNSHSHTALIRPNGRLYVSEGDGVNNWFGYSDDRGKSWIKVDTDPDVQTDASYTAQPTALIDFGNNIGLCPDRGGYGPGIWSMDPNTHRMQIMFNLSAGGPYNDASKQYGRAVYAQVGPQGHEAYVQMPDSGSGNKTTYIVATPDGGNRWGVVATIPWGAGGADPGIGIIGPDRNGNLFMRGTNLQTYGSNVMKAKILDWDKITTA